MSLPSGSSPRPPSEEQRALVAGYERLVAAARRAIPEAAVPCFAALGVELEGPVRRGARRTHLLGPRTAIGPEVSILDWQTAPLAEVFFGYREGEAFEVELDDRSSSAPADGARPHLAPLRSGSLAGRVVERALLEVERGELVGLERNGTVLRRTGGGWSVLSASAEPILRPRSAEDRVRSDTMRLVELDPTQRRAVELPRERSLLVLGEAGFGKTTVALHRMAHLERLALEARRPFSGLVIVPTRGLARLSRLLLERLEVRSVVVHTFDDWIRAEARRVFPRLPTRDAEGTGAGVIRLKRHPALRVVLPKIARRSKAKTARRTDLLHLFGDRAILERVAEVSDGTLTPRILDEVLEHTHVQFSKTTEHEYRHVDREHLETVDGRTIDDATPLSDAETLDAEDCAILFELQHLRGGPAPKSPGLGHYDHIVVDEAQELAPIELAVLGRALAPRGAITVAGDENQQVDDTAYFRGWKAVMDELGAAAHEAVVLEESYRCPPEVTALARHVIRPSPEGALEGPRLGITAHASAVHRDARLIDELRTFEARDPRATIAVIARTAEGARKLHASLGRVVSVRLALGGDFDFRPGTVVTSVAEMKGLELDVVIVPDADETTYPATSEARKALYVAVTRATHQVWLAAPGRVTPLVGPRAEGPQANL